MALLVVVDAAETFQRVVLLGVLRNALTSTTRVQSIAVAGIDVVASANVANATSEKTVLAQKNITTSYLLAKAG